MPCGCKGDAKVKCFKCGEFATKTVKLDDGRSKNVCEKYPTCR